MSHSPPLSYPQPLPHAVAAAPAVSNDVSLIFHLLFIALTLVVLAVKIWGPVALTMAALALVPVMFALFIWISWPFSTAD